MSRKSKAANSDVKVGVTCSVCDSDKTRARIKKSGFDPHKDGWIPVPRKSGVRGVADTYRVAAENIHRENGAHKNKMGVVHMEDAANKRSLREPTISGRLLDFTHGKDHNEA
jgi:hypothetical protein